MTDNRGALAQDRTSFYPADTTAIPTMRGPEDMPDASAGASFGAGWRVAQDDWPGEAQQVLNDAYMPVIEAIRRETGKPFGSYVWVGHSTAGINTDAIWRDIAAIRARRPDFLKDAGADQGAFAKQVTERTIARRQRDLGTLERARGVAGAAALGGQFAGAMADPVNLMTLPLPGGAGGTIARRVLMEGLLNAGVEAFEQPLIAAERAKRGDTLGIGEAITNIGVAGLGGAAVQGLLVEPLAGLARKHLGWGKMTEDERAAVHVLERDAEIDATSPYAPGPGSEAHSERLADAMARILADEPATGPSARAQLLAGTSLGGASVPRETFAPGADVSRAAPMPRAQFMARVRGAESSGNDLAAAGTSSAFGRYQFTAPTWLRYYKRRYGAGGLSDAQILAKRADGAVQDQLMTDLTADNAAALARIGAPETAGNLYLMHFAGQGGAGKVLRAAEDVPVRELLGADAIAANPFLRDMTAGELRRWADRRMGGKGEAGPVVRRDQFADDAEGDALWREAQRDSEAADRELAMIRRDRDGLGAEDGEPGIALGREVAGESDGPAVPRETGVEHDAPVGMDWEPAAVPVEAPRGDAPPPIDPTAELGSSANPDANMLANREYPAIASSDVALARLSERLDRIEAARATASADQGLDYTDRVLRNAAALHGVALVTPKGKPRTAAAVARDLRRIDPGALSTVLREEVGHATGDAALVARAAFERPEIDVSDFRAELDRYRAENGANAIPSEAELRGRILARRSAEVEGAADAAAVARFDDPAGTGAEAQVASIEHDLRAQLARDIETAAEEADANRAMSAARQAEAAYPGETQMQKRQADDFYQGFLNGAGGKSVVADSPAYREGVAAGEAYAKRPDIARYQIGEDGAPRGLAEIIAEWDADAAAIDAIRGCL